MSVCTLCPRQCGVDRSVKTGFCGMGEIPRVARAALHFWEEPCISGTRGSGTVFFSGCTLRCAYCQNYSISHQGQGQDISVRRLADIFRELEDQGAHNINLVTGTPFVPAILDALERTGQTEDTVVMYLSDHGENVYDEGDYSGHDYSDRIPNANVEIPFIIWFSPSQSEYAATHYPQLIERQNTPYMIDDLFHTIIDLGCIATPCFDKTRSIVNSDYDNTRPRLLEDGNLYEQKN